MDLLRTPDECFANLPGFDFEPHYVDVPASQDKGEGGELRMHYIDEGPADGQIVLCLHGEPSWSYLYRKMIPLFVAAGHRVVAPDLPGFGRSDKPASRDDYTFASHMGWMTAFVEQLDLQGITLVCQDWGGLIGTRLVGEQPDRFARVVTANTMLPTGEGEPSEAFLNWRTFSQETPDFNVGMIVNGGCVSDLGDDIVAAYNAPFPDDSYKSGARKFPLLVPIYADDPAVPANKAAWAVLEKFDRPWLNAFSDSDPVTAGGDAVFAARVPGTKGQPHTTIKGGGHFLQEDKGEDFAVLVVEFMAAT